MRKNLLTIGFAGLFVVMAKADSLRIGDDAPAIRVTNWVKGDALDLRDAKDKNVVVVEFWATWCGPCIASMPHITEVQKHLADKGVRVIGVSKEDPNNSLEKVETFVKENGEKMGYTVAFDKYGDTFDSYMKAANRNGIPCTFIIDRNGKVAWIGHPMNMDEPLADVVEGTHDLQRNRIVYDLNERFSGIRYGQLKATDEEAAATLGGLLAFQGEDASTWMMAAGYYESKENDAKAKEAYKKAFALAGDDASLMERFAQSAMGMASDPEFRSMLVKAARVAAAAKPDDRNTQLTLIAALTAAGEVDEAMGTARKALTAAAGNAVALYQLASRLADPKLEGRCGDVALQAIEEVLKLEPENLRYMTTKMQILAICKQDYKGAENIARYIVEKSSTLQDAGTLNSIAWNMLTMEGMKGHFNQAALLAAEKCDLLSEGKNWAFVDTLALAKFETGAVDQAIELEKKAIELAKTAGVKDLSSLEEPLARFEAEKALKSTTHTDK